MFDLYVTKKIKLIDNETMTKKNISEQGPLEKSLQNSVALERQKNMDNRVGIIRGSVQVTDTLSHFREYQKRDNTTCHPIR